MIWRRMAHNTGLRIFRVSFDFRVFFFKMYYSYSSTSSSVSIFFSCFLYWLISSLITICRLWSMFEGRLCTLWYSQFQKSVFRKGVVSFCYDLNINWLLSELNKLLLFFWAWIPRRPHVGHDNLKVELWVFPIIKSHRQFIFMKIIKRTSLKTPRKIQPNVLCFCFAVFIMLGKENQILI